MTEFETRRIKAQREYMKQLESFWNDENRTLKEVMDNFEIPDESGDDSDDE